MNHRCIEGERVLLRPISENDTENVLKWKNSPEVMQNFINMNLLTESAHMQWMEEQVNKGKVLQYIIHVKEEDKDIGSVYLRDIDRSNRVAEFGIFIGEMPEKSKGYGSESVQLLTEYGLGEYGLHKLFLRVFDYNASAIRCYLKAGYSIEGISKDAVFKGGTYRNLIFMSKISKSN